MLTSVYLDESLGFVVSLIGLTLAGAEVAVGLALTILMYRRFPNVYAESLQLLKSAK